MFSYKIIALTTLLFLSIPTLADEENPFLIDDHFPGGYFLMTDSLPHFMGIYMKDGGKELVEPTDKQKALIQERFKNMMSVIPVTATKIKKLESKITHEVIFKNKKVADLSDEIDQVAKLRKDLTELQISCLHFFKETLSEEQFGKMVELAKEHQH